MSDIHSAFASGYMRYVIFSFPLLVLCTKRLPHVVPMMLYRLDDCVLLSLLLVERRVCGCNQILQKYGCMLIGREGFLIVVANLY